MENPEDRCHSCGEQRRSIRHQMDHEFVARNPLDDPRCEICPHKYHRGRCGVKLENDLECACSSPPIIPHLQRTTMPMSGSTRDTLRDMTRLP